MVSAVISGLATAASYAYAGIQKSNAARREKRKAQADLERDRAELANWYARNRYNDPLQDASFQEAMTQARTNMINSIKGIAGTNAVNGGSNAVAAAMKEKAAMAMATMQSNAVARDQARKNQVEDRYLNMDSRLDSRESEMNRHYSEAQQQAISDAVVGLGNVASSAISTFAKNGEATDAAANAVAANQVNREQMESNIKAIGNYQANVTGDKIMKEGLPYYKPENMDGGLPEYNQKLMLSPKWGF